MGHELHRRARDQHPCYYLTWMRRYPYRMAVLLAAAICLVLLKHSYRFLDASLTENHNSSSFHLRYVQSLVIDEIHQYFILNKTTVSQFVFVHGSSANHFLESKAAIQSIQKSFPNHEILFYDLGLRIFQRLELERWCNVTYRYFDFSLHPSHVRNLYNYAFKPIIVESVIQERGSLLWVDSSIRFHQPDMRHTYNMAVSNGGAVLFNPSSHSIKAATNPILIDIMGMSNHNLSAEMFSANIMLLYGTKQVYATIVSPWKQCAYEEACIAPAGSQLSCDFHGKDRHTQYCNCHRYDQSVLNLLLLRFMGTPDKYTNPRLETSGGMVVNRMPERNASPKTCFGPRSFMDYFKVMIFS